MKDPLGDRMKSHYENRTRFYLPRKTYTIMRIDGKSFSSYTYGMEKPFDPRITNGINEAAMALCANIQGARFAFVNSDEISILVTDFDTIVTEAWFDNNLQKLCSVSASIATAAFNSYVSHDSKLALFDSRVFQIPQRVEVENYFIWRQQDAIRSSINSVARSLYSSKELEDFNTIDRQELIFQKGINWNDYDAGLKRGRIIAKEEYLVEKQEGFFGKFSQIRTRWTPKNPPVFTEDRNYLPNLIPNG